MAFGLNIDFGGIIGNLTNSVRSIVSSKISNLTNTIKSYSINSVAGGLVNQIQSMVGTSLNLNLSKLTGGINFANSLKGLPFPSLESLSISSLYGVIDENIGKNLNKFAKGLASSYKDLNFDEISLGDKLAGSVNNEIDIITNEVEAGTIAGKSSLTVINELDSLSNKQIRDFSFDPQLQLNFVNGLVDKQKNKIYDLSFNTVPESTIFDNQTSNLQIDSIDSFIDTNNNDFTFFNVETINETTISKDFVTAQQNKIASIKEVDNPLARKIDILNRYNKEEETLAYINALNNDFNPE
tara:strand:- start:1318 stop:2208 length:891 start_codon:yes stop_codon:yes gene_type:complete